jgi:hypothetical protein
MSTFKQICEAVLEEADGRPVDLPSVALGTDSDGVYLLEEPTQRNVVRWVNELYLQTQQLMIEGRFMHKRGVFITTTANVDTYQKPNVRDVHIQSFYTIKSGQTSRIPITVLDYEEWVQMERRYHLPASNPLWLLRKPDFSWIVWPTPSDVWTIYGEWWLNPSKFDEADDEPVWDEEYHDILKWQALRLYAAEFSTANDGAELPLLKRVQQMLPPLESAFRRRYMPRVVPASALGE